MEIVALRVGSDLLVNTSCILVSHASSSRRQDSCGSFNARCSKKTAAVDLVCAARGGASPISRSAKEESKLTSYSPSSNRNRRGSYCHASAGASVVESAHGSDLEKKLAIFWDWLKEGGVNAAETAVRPGIVPEGLGLLARRHIAVGDEVAVIPNSLCISLETVRGSPIGKVVGDDKPWVALALFILLEKADENSKWKPYLDILPEKLDSPLFWSDEELAELQGSQLLGQVEGYRELLHAEYERVSQQLLAPHPELFPEGLITLESFMWAFGILRSRAFPPLIGEDMALVPLLDLANHASARVPPKAGPWEKKSAGLFDRQQVVSMKAGFQHAPGQQVMMEYGAAKSNGQLALDYGLADREKAVPSSGATAGAADLEDNAREVFQLTLQISDADRFLDDKSDVAELSGLEATNYFDLQRGQGPPQTMVTFLRLMALGGSDAFLLEALFRNAAWGHLELPVSRENEEAICQAMMEGCRATLSGYTCGIDQDLRLLKEGGLSRAHETAVIVRLGEKRVLTETLDWFEARLQGLDNLEYYAERRLRDLGLLDDTGNMTAWVSSAKD
eukprot:jgi/Mesen1/9600/ME000657S08867